MAERSHRWQVPCVRVLLALALAVLAALGPGSISLAQAEQDAARRALSIERGTMSPFCPGMTLDSCPSPAAGEWRRDIRQWVGEGLDDGEIRQRLEQRAPGFDLSGRPSGDESWVLPVAAVALATLLLVVVTLRLRRRAGEPAPVEPSASDDPADGMDARLEQELAKLHDA